MSENKSLQHFILTRFNLLLWNRDKEGMPVRTVGWLEHRFELFERFCLPSVVGQTCLNFEWIILFDSSTPERFKEKISEFQKVCPQLVPVYVEPKNGRNFAQIFKDEVQKRIVSERIITSYLDNDDALNARFVEDVQSRAQSLDNATFINYVHGLQYFTDYNYVMRVCYPRNHFMSVVEDVRNNEVRTIYGYGSHYYVDKIKGAKMECVRNLPMWCELIHDKNMGNDAYFLIGAKMMHDPDVLRSEFALNESVRSGLGVYLFRFLPRYLRTFIRRIGYFFFGRHW